MPKKETDGVGVQIPEDLSALTVEELEALAEQATTEFDGLYDAEDIDADGLARMTDLADGIQAINGRRDAIQQEVAERLAKRDELRSRVHVEEPAAEVEAETDEVEEVVPDSVPELVTASARPKTNVKDVIKSRTSNLNVKLSDARKRAPKAPTGITAESVLVASADIPGFTQGGRLEDIMALTAAFQARGRSLPNQPGMNNRVPIASMQRQFKHTLDNMSSIDDVYKVMQSAAAQDALVAAGGWCSPSEIRYDFYNIAQVSGLLDLPTVGIRRGGIRWPVSPSFGDLSGITGLWHWNETQDVAAATGTAQSGSKTCSRVPCASFLEARLEGEGICITAGNLSTDSWPEQIANYLRLVNVAHERRINSFFINQVVAQSTAVSICVTGMGSIVPVLDAVEMQAIDLRTKYSMGDNAILEAVFPSWAVGVFRADIAKSKGLDPNATLAVSDSEIAAWFTARKIRAQWIEDYQVRASGLFGQSSAITAWPSSLQFILYPAGTFLRGNGLNLDLGIVRDSTLNATNDYTAAWSEEFFLLAKIGHESRAITVPICPSGARAADITFNCSNC